MVNNTDKGRSLLLVRDVLGYWPWTSYRNRSIETALARLRIGHVGLNKHLCRFNLSSTNLCSCGCVETVTHFLLQCPNYAVARTDLQVGLHDLNIAVTVKNMLGGGKFTSQTQCKIQHLVAQYLIATKKLGNL